MTLLVLGHTGQLARALAERAQGRLPLQLAGRNRADLRVPGVVDALIRQLRPRLVINAAAYTSVDQAENEPAEAMRLNAAAAGEAALAAAAVEASFFQVSTDYVFGEGTGPWTEDRKPVPLNVYGLSKLKGERRVAAANPMHLIVRTSWLYAPFGSSFVATMVKVAASDAEEVRVVDDQRGCPTSAIDLADALLALAERWQAGDRSGEGGILHLAGSGEASWAELAEEVMMACATLGCPVVPIRRVSTSKRLNSARRPVDSRLDSSRAAAIGLKLPDFREKLSDIVARLLVAS